ncbi:hypothetical protein [Pseudanabaena sp. FACHB-2040]|nr:hypothetical protein [Pseudanabaena sp. FACHB-2040]MBD2256670.1 hypothetical protein [Pseudanabaena sp. FACHB-2040]
MQSTKTAQQIYAIVQGLNTLVLAGKVRLNQAKIDQLNVELDALEAAKS